MGDIEDHIRRLVSQQLSQSASSRTDPCLDDIMRRFNELNADVDSLRTAVQSGSDSLQRFIQSATLSPDYQAQVLQLERNVGELLGKERAHFAQRMHANEHYMQQLATQLGQVAAQSNEMYVKYARDLADCKERRALLDGNACVSAYYSTIYQQLSARLQSALLLATGMIQRVKAHKVANVGGYAANGIGFATDVASAGIELAGGLAEGVATCLPVIGGIVAAFVRKGTEKVGDHMANKKLQRVTGRVVSTEDALRLGELAARRCAQFFGGHIERLGAKLSVEEATKAGKRSVDVMYSMLSGNVKLMDELLGEVMRTPEFAELSDEDVTARSLVRAVVRKGMTRQGLKRHGGIFEIPLTEEETRAMIQEEAKKSGGGGGKQIHVHVSGPAAAMGNVLNNPGRRPTPGSSPYASGHSSPMSRSPRSTVPANLVLGILRGMCTKHGNAVCPEYRCPKGNEPDDGGPCMRCGCYPPEHAEIGHM